MRRRGWLVGLLLVLMASQGLGKGGGLRPALAPVRVRSGLEVLLEDSLAVVRGRRVGLVTNQTGVDARLAPGWERLAAHPKIKLVRLFSPEHGLDGSRPAGEQVRDGVHEPTGLPVSSLYQGSNQVDPALFRDLDQVLFDVQDIGIRPYTFASTLAEVMKAAAKAKVEVVVLDRPNPMGGRQVGGWTLDPQWSSFVGLFATPYVHGLTIGELARLFNTRFGIQCRLRVIPLDHWKRGMSFSATGLPWIPTSPNVPTAETPLAMALTGPLGELGTVSIGIGTPSPFWLAGNETLDGRKLAAAFNAAEVPGLRAMPWTWTPTAGSWAGKACRGLRLVLTDASAVDAGLGQLALFEALRAQGVDLLAGASDGQKRMFCKVMGTDRLLVRLQAGKPLGDLRPALEADRKAFLKLRAPVLLYPD